MDELVRFTSNDVHSLELSNGSNKDPMHFSRATAIAPVTSSSITTTTAAAAAATAHVHGVCCMYLCMYVCMYLSICMLHGPASTNKNAIWPKNIKRQKT